MTQDQLERRLQVMENVFYEYLRLTRDLMPPAYDDRVSHLLGMWDQARDDINQEQEG